MQEGDRLQCWRNVIGCLGLLLIFAAQTGYAREFPVFDALLYQSKPDLTKQGLARLKVVYDGELWNKGESHERPNAHKINLVVSKLNPSVLTCLDIEEWPTFGTPEEVDSGIARYNAVVALVREEQPSLKFGYYGIVPHNDYWRATKPREDKGHREWVRENSRLKEIARGVDVIFPSLYPFYPDPKGWEKYAIENLKEARTYGKPVYAFIWPEYHDSNRIYKGQQIPPDFWRLQLETCYKYADGIVIWGGWQKRWDENAAWWIETKKFLQRKRDESRN